MAATLEQARRIASDLLAADGRAADAGIVANGGGDDFVEVQMARRMIAATSAHTARLERALRCYADSSFWHAECIEASLAFHDQGETARSALMGKEQFAQHRD